jgi:hypothetical protein
MMRNILILILLLPAFANAAEVYRWTDADGEVHYSDRPKEGAEVITIEAAPMFSAPAPAPTTSSSSSNTSSRDAGGDKGPAYSLFEIVTPEREEVLWNTGGELNVALRLTPRLQSGHTVSVFLDGEPVRKLPRGSTRAQLSDVFRGTHTLHAEVQDRGGAAVATTDPVQFTVQQTSVQNPNNPNRPLPRN